jgi:hypothetical protein
VSARSFEVLRSDQNEQSDTCLIFKVRCNLHGRISVGMYVCMYVCISGGVANIFYQSCAQTDM